MDIFETQRIGKNTNFFTISKKKIIKLMKFLKNFMYMPIE